MSREHDDAHQRAADHLERIATRRKFAYVLRHEVNTEMATILDAYLGCNSGPQYVERARHPSVIEHAINSVWRSPIPGPDAGGRGAK